MAKFILAHKSGNGVAIAWRSWSEILKTWVWVPWRKEATPQEFGELELEKFCVGLEPGGQLVIEKLPESGV